MIKLVNVKPVAISIEKIIQTFHSFSDISVLVYLYNTIPNVARDGHLGHKLFLKLLSGVELKDDDFLCTDNFELKYSTIRTIMLVYLGCMYYYLYKNHGFWTNPEVNQLTLNVSDLLQLLPESIVQMLIKFDKRAEAEDNECVEQFMLSRKPYRNATTGVKRFAVAMRKELRLLAKQETVMV